VSFGRIGALGRGLGKVDAWIGSLIDARCGIFLNFEALLVQLSAGSYALPQGKEHAAGLGAAADGFNYVGAGAEDAS
jgi:hypothetical protein